MIPLQIVPQFGDLTFEVTDETRTLVRLFFFGLIVAFIVWEIFAARRRSMQIHDVKESWSNMGIFAGVQISKVLLLGWQLLVLGIVAQFGMASWTPGVLSFLGTLLLVDFLYYWQHRAMHETKLFWAFHLVHHSGQQMNLTTSFRLNWLSPLVTPFFFIPAVLLGAPIAFVLGTLTLNLFFQFWLHTKLIPRLGFLEGIINTPSAHRVHHGSNKEYLDRNYGGILMIWDRMFGTYATEDEQVPVRYGVTTGPAGYNPFVLVFHGFVDLFRGRLESRG